MICMLAKTEKFFVSEIENLSGLQNKGKININADHHPLVNIRLTPMASRVRKLSGAVNSQHINTDIKAVAVSWLSSDVFNRWAINKTRRKTTCSNTLYDRARRLSKGISTHHHHGKHTPAHSGDYK
ncbi:hypothetical protein RRG08_013444 [Elysia crispata]|uniref:Uncharacterized protein n=1 Tax=Elysia crispata TaxID=231223 RepID=A0AAE0ZPS1_9GAST|nr:hypothetical protein RRG08_013444 [Elysia crispata]